MVPWWVRCVTPTLGLFGTICLRASFRVGLLGTEVLPGGGTITQHLELGGHEPVILNATHPWLGWLGWFLIGGAFLFQIGLERFSARRLP